MNPPRPDAPAPLVDPALPVQELIQRVPEAAVVLKARGVDVCCGGVHSLEAVCRDRGLPLGEVVRAISEARAMAGAAAGRATAPAPFRPGFLIASLLVTLTLGAVAGLSYHVRMGNGADVPISHRQIHGVTQIFGFALLYVMGIAFHAIPRMLGVPPAPRGLQRVAFWGTLLGVLLRNLGQPFAFFAFGRVLSFAAGLLLATGGGFFALFVIRAALGARRGASGRRDPMTGFLVAASGFLLATLGMAVVQGAWTAATRDATHPNALAEPLVHLGLSGTALAFVFAFASRMLPAFLGAPPIRPGAARAVLAALVPGVLLVAAAPAAPFATAAALRDAGSLLLAFAAVAFTVAHALPFGRGPLAAPAMPGTPETGVRTAFGFLLVWAVLLATGPLLGRFAHLPVQSPWWTDAVRHVFTIGFLTLLIVAISFRVLPVFSGKTLWSPRLARVTYGLLVTSAALRLLQLPAAIEPRLYGIASWSGAPAVLALVLFAVNLRKTTKPRVPRRAAWTLPAHPAAAGSTQSPRITRTA